MGYLKYILSNGDMHLEHELNLHHLELFHAVVHAGSVSGAAIRLGTSQPSVSRQIRELEERVGIPLLERLPRGMRPTEAGGVLFSHAQSIFAIRDQASQALQDRIDLSAGRLSVGASATIGNHILPGLLSEFRRHHPCPRIRFEVANTATIESRLRDGGIELGLVEGGASPEFEGETFGSDEMIAVAAPGFFDGATPPRTLSTFCQHPLILRENGAGSRHLLERTFSERGILPNILATLETTESILMYVAAGIGVALVPRTAARESMNRGEIREQQLRDAKFDLRFEWIRVPGRPLSPATSAFLEGIERLGRQKRQRRRA